MKISIFVGASIDGFIARDDGYLDFMRTVDALVVGRATYDTALAFDACVSSSTYANGIAQTRYVRAR